MIDKRIESNINNLKNLKNLLIEISNNPHLYIEDNNLKLALQSQGNLSKYENKEFNIKSSSINTIKRTSEKIFVGGFIEFDEFRKNALKKILSNKDYSLNTKEYYKNKYETISSNLDNERKINMLLSSEILNIMQSLKNIRNIDDLKIVKTICEKNIKRLQEITINFDQEETIERNNIFQFKGKKNE